MNEMWVYAPSAGSQISIPICGVMGVAGGLSLVRAWSVPHIPGVAVVSSVVLLAVTVGFLAYGYSIALSASERSILVRSRLFGMALSSKEHCFSDVRDVALMHDGDGFPFVRLEMSGGRSYSICTWNTRNTYARLRHTLDLPVEK